MKKTLIASLALLCSIASSPHEAIDQTIIVEKPEHVPLRVGQIFIIGNTRTKQSVILDQVHLYPGIVLSQTPIRQGERNLARLRIFKDGASRPTIIVSDNPANAESAFKDVLIKVEEDDTAYANVRCGLNSNGEWTLRFLIGERNSDPSNFPCCWEDFAEGRVFRGAGLAAFLRFELKVPVRELHAPSASLRVKLPVSTQP